MGHLPIVTQETVKDVIREGSISIGGTLKKTWIKTMSDIFSDVLAVRRGDLVFPWIVKGDGSDNLGFKYVFKIAGAPFFIKGEKYPIRVPLEPEGLEFENPLTEAEALDLWRRKLLWNAIGKKSLGRGRGLTHQTPMEDELLMGLLNKKNPQGPRKIKLGKCAKVGEPVSIEPKQDTWDPALRKNFEKLDPEERLSYVKLSGIPWRKKHIFATEKTLEAWLMENIDREGTKDFRKLAFENDWQVGWFANYLPFGVQGSNIDVVVLQEKHNEKIANIIELKVSSLGKKGYEKAAMQAINYALFVKRAFKALGLHVKLNVLVLSGSSQRRPSVHSRVQRSGISCGWITYKINDSGNVIFDKVI